MTTATQTTLQPRKKPLQARSAATVEAILEATIQVLVAVGKERLTTTLVAQRAGVSVGTLYQYFPNKTSLLQAALKSHMTEVSESINRTCTEHRGQPLLAMGTALLDAYLAAKMKSVQASASLYAVSSDIDGAAIAKAAGLRSLRRVSELFATAREGLNKDPEIVASMVIAAFNGTSRRLLESKSPEKQFATLRNELDVMVQAYLATCVENTKR
ncbi:transcriptional regulator, TetR family [Bryocella elongata]|uniref:Transcriptional regulator, TetR family n=1 Tax=Bryocella elongata TaxID=863522 RepID=A0A1H5ZC10_9BACT|nr:TetR/AcrR family transcriptional regulator [Bryocella elongata]SEG33842.1 transcriptional regulator, TetR family [Bryocella elongata]